MPSKSLKPCNKHMCPNLTTTGYCETHKPTELQQQRSYDKYRGTAAQRGYDSKWRKARKGYLAKYPLCVDCINEGVYVPATVVDHIIPHKGDKGLFWDSSNWQSLCEMHHNRKTAREDGGFGNVQ